MKKLYLECTSGISGDMTVAALFDLGVDIKVLQKALESLPLEGYRIDIKRVQKSGIDACDFHVVLEPQYENHDHDMQFLHGKIGHQPHEDAHSHNHQHQHQQAHGQEHSHEHRTLPGILHLIDHGDMTERAKTIAKKIFTILGEAEAKAHGKLLEEVHFHEVGAIDSIVDIVAVAVCVDALDVMDIVVPYLCEGQGVVRCQHGMMPIPVPAVLNIVEGYGISLKRMDVEGEFVTPTGAAIVAALSTEDTLPGKYKVTKTGIGAGKRMYERPSLMRAMLIESEDNATEFGYRLETNIDDCTGEALGFVMELLLEAGARDVNYIPAFMKKNRPAYLLNVVCFEEDIERLEAIIYQHTTTIGIRRIPFERSFLTRKLVSVQTEFGPCQVKVCQGPSGDKIYPEYESVTQICRTHFLSFQEVYSRIQIAAEHQLRDGDKQ